MVALCIFTFRQKASLLVCGESARLFRAYNSTPSEMKDVTAHEVAETLTAWTPSVFDHGFDGALIRFLNKKDMRKERR